MPKGRQHREGLSSGHGWRIWSRPAAPASDAVVIISPRGSIPDILPGDDEPQASPGAATGFSGIGAASPEVEP